jgi:hypothetical protein
MMNLTKICGPKTKGGGEVYSYAEIKAFAGALGLKKNGTISDLCKRIQEEMKKKHGVDIPMPTVAAPTAPKPTKKKATAAPAAAAPATAATATAQQQPLGWISDTEVRLAPGIVFDTAFDCAAKKTAKITNAFNRAELTAFKAEVLKFAPGVKFGAKNADICEALRTEILKKYKKPAAAAAAASSPVAVVAAQTTLGWINAKDVRLAPGVIFNMNIECDSKKAVGEKYVKADLARFREEVLKFAPTLKFGRKNEDNCKMLKEAIMKQYKKPSDMPSVDLPPSTPTPAASPSNNEELIKAIRRCLNLT